jgi:hypothetical protein
MLGYILLPIFNVALYFGMVYSQGGVLNIAIAIMWFIAILTAFSTFTPDEELLKQPDKHWFRKVVNWTLIVGSALHSVYWGYFWAPAILVASALILYLRRQLVHNKKRY